MKTTKTILAGLTAVVLAVAAAAAAEPAKTMDVSLKAYTDQNGMTLYIFKKDTKGADTSACTDKCIEAWPPFLAAADAKAEGEWTLVKVKDKDGADKMMWAYEGWPLYTYVKDKKPGDATGQGVGEVWYVAQSD